MTTTSTKPQVTIKFFALIREQIGLAEIIEPLNVNDTLDDLKNRLISKDEAFNMALSGPVVMACNQTIVGPEHCIVEGDEIAFFPPVTGG